MVLLPILFVFIVTQTTLLVSCNSLCKGDEKLAGDACDEIEEAVSFLQTGRAKVPLMRDAPSRISTNISSSTNMCLAALKESVDAIIGIHLKEAPRPFMLWDPAMHSNIGDNLITLAEDSLLQPYSPSVCCIASCSPEANTRCPMTQAEAAKGAFGTYILHGGGNWGDLYAQPQYSRIILLEALASCCPNTMIIGMPQNLFYNDTKQEEKETFRIESAIKKFTTPPVFFWRDRESFKKALALYPTATNVIVPEVVWTLHPLLQYAQREYPYDVLVSSRREESLAGAEENIGAFQAAAARHEAKAKVLYTNGWEDFTFHDAPGNYSSKRYNHTLLSYRLNGAVTWISSAPTLVADKLHMAILALLAGSKSVFVDNSYDKLHGTLEASFALAGHKCSNMRSEILGVGASVEKNRSTIPWITPAADFQSAANKVLNDAWLAETRKPLQALQASHLDGVSYVYKGCFVDVNSDRDLPVLKGRVKQDDECATLCKGYQYFSLQYNSQCWCGNSFGKHGPRSDCSCSATFIGGQRNCVYELQDVVTRTEAFKSEPNASSTLIKKAAQAKTAQPVAAQQVAAQRVAAQQGAAQQVAAQQATQAQTKLQSKLADTEARVHQLQLQLKAKASSDVQTGAHSFFSESCPLYVGIMSAPKNQKKRAAVRSAYLNEVHHFFSSRGIIAEFLIGHAQYNASAHGLVPTPQDLQLEHDLNAEAAEHGDIQRISFPEGYQNLPDKVLHLLQRGVQKKCAFIMKIDDDQVLNILGTIDFLETRDPQELLYAGKAHFPKQLYREQSGADGAFAPYFSGNCYLMSWKLAHQIVEVHADHTAMFTAYGSSSEDVDVGHWVQWEAIHGGKVEIVENRSFIYWGKTDELFAPM